MNHLEQIEHLIGNLSHKKILDVGSGRGYFLLLCARKGYRAIGIEINPQKIATAHQLAVKENLSLEIRQGVGELMPFKDSEFDFINISEVIEHVKDPLEVLKEVHRMLSIDGCAYISVHNRYGLYDAHFHIFGLGWLPRAWASAYISLWGKHKEYDKSPDYQKIQDMHYYTFGSFKQIASSVGFTVVDTREEKIRKQIKGIALPVGLFLYRAILRPFGFNTFHLLLRSK
jgi:SAM-dependent methyltransferase